MSVAITAQSLYDVELLKNLTVDELEQFLSGCDDLQFVSGDTIFKSGEVSRAIYILLHGTVRLELADSGERPAVLAELTPTAVFGESNFFHPAPHRTTATCLTETRVLRFARERYDEMLQQRVATALRIGANAADLLASRLQQTDEWLARWLAEREGADARRRWTEFRHSLGLHSRGAAGMRVGANLE